MSQNNQHPNKQQDLNKKLADDAAAKKVADDAAAKDKETADADAQAKLDDEQKIADDAAAELAKANGDTGKPKADEKPKRKKAGEDTGEGEIKEYAANGGPFLHPTNGTKFGGGDGTTKSQMNYWLAAQIEAGKIYEVED